MLTEFVLISFIKADVRKNLNSIFFGNDNYFWKWDFTTPCTSTLLSNSNVRVLSILNGNDCKFNCSYNKVILILPQVYPALEYDYVPNTAVVERGSYIHFQWTGSNNNPQNNNGRGRAGSDRNNVVLLRKPVRNLAKHPREATKTHISFLHKNFFKLDFLR